MVNVVIGTVPIVIAGVIMKLTGLDDHIRSTTLVAINAIVFGVLLYLADSYGLLRNSVRDLNWKSALIIGGAQALSLSPGTSRSGITMTAGRGPWTGAPRSCTLFVSVVDSSQCGSFDPGYWRCPVIGHHLDR